MHLPGCEPIACPAEAEYLWEYFVSMNARRTNNGYGSNPITETDLAAWAARRGIVLEPFEGAAIDAMEQLFLQCDSKRDRS